MRIELKTPKMEAMSFSKEEVTEVIFNGVYLLSRLCLLMVRIWIVLCERLL